MSGILPFRLGIGDDLHRLEVGRRLILGGIEIPFEKGLAGHSDADVLIHAVIDALTGAAGLPDIGQLFPDTEARWKDASSATLLALVVKQVEEAGYRPAQVEVIIHAQAPRLAPYKKAICERMADLLGIKEEDFNVKAKTGEGLGEVGRGEAISAQALCVVVRHCQHDTA